jgi:hypothetical protein
MDEEAPYTEEDNEDAGEGEIVEEGPVRAVHTPDVKPRVHPVRVPPSILKRKRAVPMRPKLAESYHSIFHPDGESFLHEDEDEKGKQEHEEYSDEDEGYDAEEEQVAPSPVLSKARAVGFVAPIRPPPLARNSLRHDSARDRYTRSPLHTSFLCNTCSIGK